MGTLAYTVTMSLDGYAADVDGDFQWTAPSSDVFAFHVERMAAVSVEVLGRKTFQLMQYWEDFPDATGSPDEVEFARRWRRIEKVAASTTLTDADLGSTRATLVRDLTTAHLRTIVDGTDGAVEIFGPTVAAPAIIGGLVDDFHFFVVPKIVGGGLRALPDRAHGDLTLVDHRIFENGTAYLHYRPA